MCLKYIFKSNKKMGIWLFNVQANSYSNVFDWFNKYLFNNFNFNREVSIFKLWIVLVKTKTNFFFFRYLLVYKPHMKLNTKKTIILIILSILLGVSWSLYPLIGWSHYTLEGGLTSCCIEWNDRSLNVISYNITIFVFILFLPLIIIIFTNVKVLLFVSIQYFLVFLGGSKNILIEIVLFFRS